MHARFHLALFLFTAALAFAGCGKSSTGAGGSAADAGLLKISPYELAEYCDLAAGSDGTLHAVLTDRSAHGKSCYVFYRSSTDSGKTWSEPVNLSDDESGQDAGYARVLLDGKGRVYAVWKYVAHDTLLDGPGGDAPGRIVCRCLAGGAWSPRALLGDDRVASYSWFAAADPGGTVHVVWSQLPKDVAALPGAYTYFWYADLVRQATLDGANVGTVKDLIAPPPLLTQAEQDKLKAAGHYPKYEDTTPRKDGLINLRGYVDAQGAAHFVAQHPGNQDGPTSQQTGRRIVRWDGKQLTVLYAFDRFGADGGNTFNDPPALLLDAAGKEHLIRAPEKAEKACVRDYPIVDGKLGDPAEVLAPKAATGALFSWQAHALPGGGMAVTAAISQKGGLGRDDTELYLSVRPAGGAWSPAECLTNNEARTNGFEKETGGGNAVAALHSYRPKFASVALAKDGRPGVLAVICDHTILGLTSPGVTAGGELVSVMGTGSVDNPAVYFMGR